MTPIFGKSRRRKSHRCVRNGASLKLTRQKKIWHQRKKKKSGNSASSTSSQKLTVADDEQAQVPSPRRPATASAAEPVSNSTVGLSDLKTTVKTLKRDLNTATGEISQLKKDLQKQVRDSRTEMDSLASRLDKVENKGTMTIFFVLHCFMSSCLF